uniref:Ovule protein n=1 Tax=Mesocestoides corti TaxID=53468 RepID=A0A5K3FYU5_MESCO
MWPPNVTRWNVGVHRLYVIRNITYSHEPSTTINYVVSPTSSHLYQVPNLSCCVAQLLRQRKCFGIAEYICSSHSRNFALCFCACRLQSGVHYLSRLLC